MCGNIFCAPANIWFEKSFAISKLGTKHLIEKVKLLFLVAWKLKLSAALACVPNKKFPLQTGILYEVVKFSFGHTKCTSVLCKIYCNWAGALWVMNRGEKSLYIINSTWQHKVLKKKPKKNQPSACVIRLERRWTHLRSGHFFSLILNPTMP